MLGDWLGKEFGSMALIVGRVRQVFLMGLVSARGHMQENLP